MLDKPEFLDVFGEHVTSVASLRGCFDIRLDTNLLSDHGLHPASAPDANEKPMCGLTRIPSAPIMRSAVKVVPLRNLIVLVSRSIVSQLWIMSTAAWKSELEPYIELLWIITGIPAPSSAVAAVSKTLCISCRCSM